MNFRYYSVATSDLYIEFIRNGKVKNQKKKERHVYGMCK